MNAFTSDKESLDWARSHTGFCQHELVRESPWSRTFKLTATDGSDTFLKVVLRPEEIRITPILSRIFPDNTPAVIASDVDRGLLLMKDHGGRTLSSRSVSDTYQLLSTYAALQAQAANLPEVLSAVPAYDASLALEDLIFCLCPERGTSSRSLRLETSAQDFIGAEEAARYCDALMQRSTLILGQIARAVGLPKTLAHGGLRAGNAAMMPDGTCVLYDWGEVGVGPAGLSLCNPRFMKSTTRATRLLTSLSAAGDDDSHRIDLSRMNCSFRVLAEMIGEDEVYRGLLCTYIDRLAACGYATRDVLLAGLPGSILAGAMRWPVSWSLVGGHGNRLRKVAGDRLSGGLDDILELCDLLEHGPVNDTPARTTTRLCVRNPDVTTCQEGDEVILSDPGGQSTHHLNGTAGAIWQLLDEPISLEQAVDILQTAFPEAPRKQVESDTLAMIARFIDSELVTLRG